MLSVNINRGALIVAYINRQHPGSGSFDPANPWLLLYVTGITLKFPSLAAARKAAVQRWEPLTFKRVAP